MDLMGRDMKELENNTKQLVSQTHFSESKKVVERRPFLESFHERCPNELWVNMAEPTLLG